MITISVCMIVKNEEKNLRRCLDSMKGLWEELIIVDTGSSDKTKEIAAEYTDKVFDFAWVDDFSAARNFSLSKATCDYIYIADADEVLDEKNRKNFKILKAFLEPEIEIVQMRYVNQLSNGSVYNFDAEYRPKLFKRIRNFTFIDPVHETVRLDPVVFDSDVDIIHMQEEVHGLRDIRICEKTLAAGGVLGDRLTRMYARELLLAGEPENFAKAATYFENLLEDPDIDPDIMRLCYIVLSKNAVLKNDLTALMKYSIKDIIVSGSSELCSILGGFYEERGDLNEAAVWYYNAHYETRPEICLNYNREIPLEALIRIYEKKGDKETADNYRNELKTLTEVTEKSPEG